MTNKQDAPPVAYTFLGAIVGALLVYAAYQHQESTLNARWEAVTGTTLEEVETNLKQCQRGARCRSTLLIEVYGVKGSVR